MKTLNALFATLLLTGAGTALAASSVDLTVRGLITPSACEPTLSNGGVADVGKISAKDLNVDRPTGLVQQTLQLTVMCDSATLMALEATDNRAGSNYEDYIGNYGLGFINTTEKLGDMEMRILNPVADGVAARVIVSEDSGLTWSNGRYFARDNIVSVANTSVDAPIPVQLFTGDLTIAPRIAPTNTLTLTEEVPIDGAATLTVKYL
ncbi:DUF1120 domain-containing protein [Pseudomonas sp. LF245]